MQLSRKTSARLEKLIDALLTYCARERRPELLSGGHLAQDVLPEAADIVWAEGGDLTLIDAFVKTNPGKLNRTDLRQVFSWKKALRADFCFCRHGKDTVLLAGDYAFCVRGTDQELDDAYSQYPMYAQTVILPYDGVLAHVGFAIVTPIEEDLDVWGQRLVSAVDLLSERRHLIRTERQFLQVSGSVETGGEPYLPRLLPHDEMGAGIKPVDDARLSTTYLTDEDIEEFEDCTLMAEPTCDYHDILMLHSREQLRQIAWSKDIVFDTNELLAMTDDELATRIAEDQLVTDTDILIRATSLGHEVVETLRRVHDADGMLKVDLVEEHVRPWEFFELESVLFLFRYLGSYYFVMPYNVLSALDDIDWNYHIACARRIDAAIVDLESIVRERGAVELEPTIRALFNGASDHDDWLAALAFKLVLDARVTYPSTTVRVVFAPDDGGGEGESGPARHAYAVSLSVYHELSLDEWGNAVNLDVLRRYLSEA